MSQKYYNDYREVINKHNCKDKYDPDTQMFGRDYYCGEDGRCANDAGNRVSLKDVSTERLVEELCSRPGVEEYHIDVCETSFFSAGADIHSIYGPALMFVIGV